MQKQQRIEAINGGWAVLGLTVGIVFEGYTGKSILAQVSDYLNLPMECWAFLNGGLVSKPCNELF